MTERVQKALELFNSGYNCSQAVFMAYADLLGLTNHQAAMVACGFGGGIGRLRQNCGAYSGMIMLCALMEGEDGDSAEKRADTYARVQKVHGDFVERLGTINCAELLNRPPVPESPVPEERTASYYASRPCARIVQTACEIVEKHLMTKE